MWIFVLLTFGFPVSVYGQLSSIYLLETRNVSSEIQQLLRHVYFHQHNASHIAVIVTWNSTRISESSSNRDDRVLIYHDEIAVRTNASGGVPDGPGVLVCRSSERGKVTWLRPSSDTPIQSNNNNNFRVIGSIHWGQDSDAPISRVQLARTRSISQDIASNEGLWACNHEGLPPLHVAIYARGNGAIATNVVTLQSSSFTSSPPTFTLVGSTTGGPPTNITWLRNGRSLTHSISFTANPNNDQEGRVNAHYQSTLVVTGRFLGVYEYQASNRAASGSRRANLTIEGGDPTNLTVVLIGNSTIRASWTPPAIPPSRGYRIIDVGKGLDRYAPSSPHELVLPPGDYNIRVMYTSLHFPGGSAGPQLIAVLGALQPVIASTQQPNATTVILSWTQPQLSFTPHYYQLTLTQLTNSSQNHCDGTLDCRSERRVGGSGSFTNLRVFSFYRIRVTAHFHIGGKSLSAFTEKEISTETQGDRTGRDVGIATSVTFLLTSTTTCAVVVLVGYAVYRFFSHNKKETATTTDDMDKNVAYGKHQMHFMSVSKQ